MKITRRIINVCLLICLMISILPLAVIAQETAAVSNRILLNTSELSGQSSVWIDGMEYAVQASGNLRYVDLPDGNARTMVTYTYNTENTSDRHTQYPVGMKVWMLENQNGIYSATRKECFDNILQYSGMSIRVTGKKGIRMITSVETVNKEALISEGLAGYYLKEYGTAIAWSNQLTSSKPLVLGKPYVKSNHAYKEDIADPVFGYQGNLMQYTNVLVNFSNEQCKNDIAMRPYMILESPDGESVTLYGGTVHRSIGYIAYQNRKGVFEPGTSEHAFIWDIIHSVYGNIYDDDMNIGPNNSKPEITVANVHATAGNTVDVAVSLKNNPGMVGMTLKLNYDESAMTLTSVSRGEALSEMTFTPPRNLSTGCQFPWDAEEVLPQNATNGEILTLTFAIAETAAPGDYNVALSYNNGAIIDNDLNPLDVTIHNGTITVTEAPVKTYTVSFVDHNGTILKTETVSHGGNATAPAAPFRDGYVFIGWDKTFTNVTSDLTISALYERVVGNQPTITVANVSAAAGSTVDVAVSLKNNPGMVGMTLKLNYDESALTLTSVTKGEALSEMTFTKPRNLASGCQFPWDAEEVLPEDATNGDILILTFTVAKTAASGNYDITLSYNNGAIIDNDLSPIDVAIQSGTITVTKAPVKTYTVSFVDHNGTILKTETVSHGGNATAPAAPFRDGYVFTGWDKTFTNVTSDLTISALYERVVGNQPTITVANVSAAAGSTVDVAVSLKNNPGMVGMTLKLNYDESALTLTSVTKGEALSEMTFTKPRNLASGCQFPWDAEEVLPEDATNGDILILTFTVAKTAASGNYDITLSYNDGAIIDNDLMPVEVIIKNGIITVS